MTRVLALLASTAVGGSGCADRAAPDFPGVRGEREADLSVNVTNQNFLDVVVYVSRDATWHRLGTVTGVGSETLDLPRGLGSPPGEYRLRVHPIGAPDRYDYVTDVIIANPGDVIELTVASSLRMSSWYIRPRS